MYNEGACASHLPVYHGSQDILRRLCLIITIDHFQAFPVFCVSTPELVTQYLHYIKISFMILVICTSVKFSYVPSALPNRLHLRQTMD